jgi:hypothetical protein
MKRSLLLCFAFGFIACLAQAQITPKIYSRWSGRVIICSDTLNLFQSYQWYEDNTTALGTDPTHFSAIAGATKQYYEKNGTGMQGYYYVHVTFKDGTEMNSDTISLHTQVESASVSPNPVSKSSIVRIATSSSDVLLSNIQIFTASGIKVSEYNTASSSSTEIEPPSTTGCYLIHIRFASGETTVQKLFVK